MTVSKFYLISLTPPITKTIVNILAERSHADRAAFDIKHVKWDIIFKAWIRVSGVDFRGGAEAKI